MADQAETTTTIIKRKRNVIGAAHHGGAWKVAYADFVTAMMAFFLLMWLLNSTTEQNRYGLADYFNPTVIYVENSGGGQNPLSGDSVNNDTALAQSGTGVASGETTVPAATADADAGAEAKETSPEVEQEKERIDQTLMARSGESMTMERLLRHVVTRVTDEGLVISLFDTDEETLFVEGTDEPTDTLKALAQTMVETLGSLPNKISIQGHLSSQPKVLRENMNWNLSSLRAQRMQILLEKNALPDKRIQRIVGYGDRQPTQKTPVDIGNNRIDLVLLKDGR